MGFDRTDDDYARSRNPERARQVVEKINAEKKKIIEELGKQLTQTLGNRMPEAIYMGKATLKKVTAHYFDAPTFNAIPRTSSGGLTLRSIMDARLEEISWVPDRVLLARGEWPIEVAKVIAKEMGALMVVESWDD